MREHTSVGLLCEDWLIRGRPLYMLAVRPDSWPAVESDLRCRELDFVAVPVALGTPEGGWLCWATGPFSGTPAPELAAAFEADPSATAAAERSARAALTHLLIGAHADAAGPAVMSYAFGRIATGRRQGRTRGTVTLEEPDAK